MKLEQAEAIKLAESKINKQTTTLTGEVYNTLNTLPSRVNPNNGRFMEQSFQIVKEKFLESVQRTYDLIKAIQQELNITYNETSLGKIKEISIELHHSSLEIILDKHKEHIKQFGYSGFDDSARFEWVKHEIENEFVRLLGEMKIENAIKQDPTNVVIQKKQLKLAVWGLIVTGGIGVILKLLIDNNFFR